MCKVTGANSPVHPPSPRGQASLPRRRESIVGGLVPRLRGEDELEGDSTSWRGIQRVGERFNGLGRDVDAGGDFVQALS